VTVARTTDGGRTWTRRTPFDGYWPYGLSFVDPLRGFVLTAARRGGSGGLLWATEDGGRRWRIVLHSAALVSTPP
jgi:photosystem II stability/assembly factor-like uncharacterized protein